MKALKLEILATNEVNKFIKLAITDLLPQLTPFIGKKVFLSGGNRAKNFNPTFLSPQQIEGIYVNCNMYLKSEYGKLNLILKYCMNGGSYDVIPKTAFTKYVNRSITIGHCKDGQIIDSKYPINQIFEENRLNEEIDLNIELEKINTLKKLELQINEIKKTIKVDSEYYKYL